MLRWFVARFPDQAVRIVQFEALDGESAPGE
jgi:hypothetical protein